MTSLWKTLIETSLARIYTLLVGAVILFLVARHLGPEGQGVVAAATAWATLFSAFGGLSLGQVAHYRVQVKKSDQWLTDLFGPLLLLTVLLTVATYVIVTLVYCATVGKLFKDIPFHILGIAFAIIPFLIWEEYSRNLLVATGKLRVYNMSQFWGRSFWLFGIIVLIYFKKMEVFEVLCVQLAGQAFIAAIGFSALGKQVHFMVRIKGSEIVEMLKGAGKLHLNTVGSFLLAQNTVIMLNYFSEKSDVGYYHIAFQMAVLPAVIAQSASLVLFSKMSDLGPDGVWPLQKRLSLQILAIVTFISICAYISAPLLVPLLVGKSFEPSIEIFRLLLPCALGMTVAQLMTPQWIGRGAFILTTIVTFGVAIGNVVFNAFLIPRFGIMGAVWANLVCYVGIAITVQALFAWWCEKKYLLLHGQQRIFLFE
jgi:O-antigen/teichoic acid export membrane protein